MSLRQYKSVLLYLLFGSVFVLSACKTPPTPPEPPQPAQKPPPSIESPSATENIPKRIHEPAKVGEIVPEIPSTPETNAPEQRNEPPPVEQGDVTKPPQAIPASPQPPKPAPTTASPDTAHTSGELTSDMERELRESLSAFDGKLLKERKLLLEDLQDAGTGGERSGGAMGDISPTGAEGTDEVNGTLGESRPVAPDSDKLPETTSDTAGKAERGGTRSGSIPPDIPDGRDDDIVARQIREAAMREDDPELRKKLWEEYRKYKQSSSANTP